MSDEEAVSELIERWRQISYAGIDAATFARFLAQCDEQPWDDIRAEVAEMKALFIRALEMGREQERDIPYSTGSED